jgi:L-seryl-tRNA(Ser) seleniumtransferase
VVTFSGDKLLGGPQAGLVAGTRPAVDAMRRNPLYRALRVDKLTVAALDAVLADHESGMAQSRVPVLRMLAAGVPEIERRASAFGETLRAAAPGLRVDVRPGGSAIGGGAGPDVELPTALLTLAHPGGVGAERLAARLRQGRPPVVARLADDRVVIDLRTVEPSDEPLLRDALLAALG